MKKTTLDEPGVLIKTKKTECHMRQISWLTGSYLDYKFSAKVHDVGSEYGIDCGRTSQLYIWKDKEINGSKEPQYIAEYDVHWIRKPKTKKDEAVYKKILFCLERGNL